MNDRAPVEKTRPRLDPFFGEVERVIIGQRRLLERIAIALMTGGHLLVEGVPGLAKTLAVRTAARALDLQFARIQFTPDLLPADVIGTQVYQPQSGTFTVKTGPVFANIVLADEINRAPAKVQSALLEAMEELQVTIAGETHPLPRPFLVLATQNPIEHEGTYPLPEAQLDRFMFKVRVDYPSAAEELAIMDRFSATTPAVDVKPALGTADLQALRAASDRVFVDDQIKKYLLDVVRATRTPRDYGLKLDGCIRYGAGPRAALHLLWASRAHALLDGRDYVVTHDVKSLAPDVLRHRIILGDEALADDLDADAIIARVLGGIPVP